MLRVDGVDAVLAGRRVLSDIALHAARGEVVAVVGPNGAGKSSLLRVILGLLRTSGTVTWDGGDLHSLAPRERARIVGLVPQSAPRDQPFTVREIVAMGRFAHATRFGASTASDAAAIDHALARMRLGPLASRPITQLSGGEAQRVTIARVLAQDPALFLFDEPTANLDLGQAAEVRGLLRALAAEGRVVVVVVHDLEAAAQIADRMVLLSDGRVVASGPPRDVLQESVLQRVYDVSVRVDWEGPAPPRVRVLI